MRSSILSPHVDKGDELGGEPPLVRVAELWRISSDHLGQLVEHAVPLGVGEPARGQLVLKRTNAHVRTYRTAAKVLMLLGFNANIFNVVFQFLLLKLSLFRNKVIFQIFSVFFLHSFSFSSSNINRFNSV